MSGVLVDDTIQEPFDFFHFNDFNSDWLSQERDQPVISFTDGLPENPMMSSPICHPSETEECPFDFTDFPTQSIDDIGWTQTNPLGFSVPIELYDPRQVDKMTIDLRDVRLKHNDEKKRHQTPKAAEQEISKWLLQNRMNPYPTSQQKMIWCKSYDMPMCQLNTFLTNKRVRLLGKKSSRQLPLMILQAYGIKPKLVSRKKVK